MTIAPSPRREHRRALAMQRLEVWLVSELGTLRHPMVVRCANERCHAPVDVEGELCRWCASFDRDLEMQVGVTP